VNAGPCWQLHAHASVGYRGVGALCGTVWMHSWVVTAADCASVASGCCSVVTMLYQEQCWVSGVTAMRRPVV
jgi:hypothetical protein